MFTARKRSCGKVMFLHLSVILFTGGGLPDKDSSGQRPPWTEIPCTVKSGRYASYWNALLFHRRVSVLLVFSFIFCGTTWQETRKYSSRISSHEADCEQNDWQTPVKTLPSLAVGKNEKSWTSEEPFLWSAAPKWIKNPDSEWKALPECRASFCLTMWHEFDLYQCVKIRQPCCLPRC